MSGPDPIAVLLALVKAHEVPIPGTGSRDPILHIQLMNEAYLQHHALPEDTPAHVDKTVLEELAAQDLISIDYTHVASGTLQIVPMPRGRALAEEHERAQSKEPVADLASLLAAVAGQAEADNSLAWPAVRPVLVALRDYWAAGGLSMHGIQLRPIGYAVPQEHEGLFVATIRSLLDGDYLRADGMLSFAGLPSEVQLTDRARSVIDGWPGAEPTELVENLLAVLSEQARTEKNPEQKRRLESIGKTIKELGVATASETLAKVLTGGI
jgi:hypothetical protein